MTRPWLLYGAYGYTGRLIAERAVVLGHSPVLAGRDAARIGPLADELGLDARVFGLDDPAEVQAGIHGVDAVLHAAGPFVDTYRPVVEACLAERCHYLDITGEIEVLEAIFSMDARASARGVALVPAVGFDVVPTDCLAALVAAKVPAVSHVDLAFLATGRPSGGSLKGILDGLAKPGAVRLAGRIVEVPHGSVRRHIHWTDGARGLVAIPWGDVSTAFYSTGAPNVRVFTEIGRAPRAAMSVARPLLRSAAVRSFVKRVLDGVGGPSRRELREGQARVWCEAWNGEGSREWGELMIPNGYSFTADSALSAVLRLLAPEPDRTLAGAMTPSMAFGTGFLDALAGVTWVRRP